MLQVIRFYHSKVAELGVAIPQQQTAAEGLKPPPEGDDRAPLDQARPRRACMTHAVMQHAELHTRTQRSAQAWHG